MSLAADLVFARDRLMKYLYGIQKRMLHINIAIAHALCEDVCLVIKRRNKIARQVLNAHSQR